MLHYKLITMKSQLKILALITFLSGVVFLSGCDEDPEPEDVEEEITKVVLTFTPSGGSAIVVEAEDFDLGGVGPFEKEPIALNANTTYTLTIEMFNGFYEPTDDDYNVTTEVAEEAEEHQLFFSWSTGVFTSPTGTGNIGSIGVVNYEDQDDNNLPLGLETTWTTSSATTGKEFRILLKHQPNEKSATSTSDDGGTDLDLTFPISINE